MIALTFDLITGVAKLVQAAVIVLGGDVPVRVVFATSPGSVDGLQLALGTDGETPAILAFTEDFTEESDTVWVALLDASDTRLADYMADKGATAISAELVCTLDGVRRPAPHVAVTVQRAIISGAPTSESGPFYVPSTVAGKYRFKDDGTFQLWNPTQSKFHTLSLTGAAGAELLGIGAGET